MLLLQNTRIFQLNLWINAMEIARKSCAPRLDFLIVYTERQETKSETWIPKITWHIFHSLSHDFVQNLRRNFFQIHRVKSYHSKIYNLSNYQVGNLAILWFHKICRKSKSGKLGKLNENTERSRDYSECTMRTDVHDWSWSIATCPTIISFFLQILNPITTTILMHNVQ